MKGVACDEYRVCLLAEACRFMSKSMSSVNMGETSSSLVSAWTSGDVGGWYRKLEREDDSEDGLEVAKLLGQSDA